MHQQLYGMLPERFAACYIGKPIQKTENYNVEDELQIIMNIYLLKLLYVTVCPFFL